MFRFLFELITRSPGVRLCFTLIAGLWLICLSFLIAYLGIRGASQGNYNAIYVAALCLFLIVAVVFIFLWDIRKKYPGAGGPMIIPPPSFMQAEDPDKDKL